MRHALFSTLALGALGICSAQSVQNIVLYPDSAGAIGGGGGTNNTRKVLMGDVDGDGDLDMVAINFGGPIVVHINDGLGSFSIDTDPDGESLHDNFVNIQGKGGCLFDWDADGDLDLAVARGSSGVSIANMMMPNDGDGPGDPDFVNPGAGQLLLDGDVDHSYDIVVFDGDGGAQAANGTDTIVLVANRAAANRMYRNGGGTGFLGNEVTDDPFVTGPVLSSRDLLVEDFDGDGVLDVFVCNAGNGGQDNQMFLNDGTGSFTDESDDSQSTNPGGSYGAAAGDLDGDGDADIVVANRGGFTTGERNFLIENRSSPGTWDGVRVLGSPVTVDTEPSYDVAIGDLDGDGDLDVAVANNGVSNAVYMSNLADDVAVTSGNFFTGAVATAFSRVTHGAVQASRGLSKSVTIGEVQDYSGNPSHQGAEVALSNGGTLGGAATNFFYRSFGRMFADLGGGATITATQPRLSGDGFVSNTTNAALFIEGGATGAGVDFVVRATLAPTAAAFNGGTNFVNGAGDATLTVSQLSSGEADVDITGGVPAVLEGVPVVFQAFVDDPDGLGPLQAMTNGLSVVIQS